MITVDGEMPAVAMGKTLHHKHLLVDFIGADSTGYHCWNHDSVVYPKFLPEPLLNWQNLHLNNWQAILVVVFPSK